MKKLNILKPNTPNQEKPNKPICKAKHSDLNFIIKTFS